MKVWKVGSRWSNDGNSGSIIDLFRKYQIVFNGNKGEKILRNVKIDDFLAISDGTKIVAISKVLDKPKPITEFDIQESDKHRFHFEEWVICVKVKIVDIPEEEYVSTRIGSFHENFKENEKLIEIFNSYFVKNFENTFINSGLKVVIPSYQRAYAWESKQIEDFCNDLYEIAGKDYYYGHFIIEENSGKYEIIDGQQRLTTFVLFVLSSKLFLDFKISSKIEKFIQENFETIDYDQKRFEDLVEKALQKNILTEKEENDTASFTRMIDTIFSFKKFFEKCMKDKINIEVLISTILKAHVSTHITKDKKIAVQIFELQNSRGIKLDILEKVKAKLMKEIYLYSINAESDIIEIQKNFSRIYQLEEKTSSNSFRGDLKLENILLHHLRVIDDGKKTLSKDLHSPGYGNLETSILNYISGQISSKQQKEEKVRYIIDLSKLFEKSIEIVCENLISEDEKNPLVGDCIILERNLSLELFLILCHSKTFNYLDLRKWELLLFTRNFHEKYYRKRYSDEFQWLFKEAIDGKIIESLDRYLERGFREDLFEGGLQKVFSEYVEVKKVHILTNGYGFLKDKMTYLLYKYEICLDERIRGDLRTLFKTSKSLEHILPQTWDKSWINHLENEDAKVEFIKSINGVINGIGNLLLLSTSENSSESNTHPKCKIYEISFLSSYKEHNENRGVWDLSCNWQNLINERGEKIYEFMLKYFKAF